MTREESWQVEGVTLTILRHIASLGYTVSVFRIPSSLLGTRPGSVELQAMDLAAFSTSVSAMIHAADRGTAMRRQHQYRSPFEPIAASAQAFFLSRQ
jgi:hypothetical protein